jgi:hypothetical protein
MLQLFPALKEDQKEFEIIFRGMIEGDAGQRMKLEEVCRTLSQTI